MSNADLDNIKKHLAATTKSWPDMVKRYGSDYTKWPASTQWAFALGGIDSLYEVQPAPQELPVPYDWNIADATKLADQTVARYIPTNLWTPNGPGGVRAAVFGGEVPIVHAPVGTPKVRVTATFGTYADVPLPPGVQHGPTGDAHLCVVDDTDKACYNFEQINTAARTASGAGIVPPGKVSEVKMPGMPNQGISNAARFNLYNCITVEDILAGRLKTLVFGMHDEAVQGHPSLYPADTDFNDSRILYGQWVGLDPSKTPPTYPNMFLTWLDKCLRVKGAMMRDQADAFTFYGKNYVNEGGPGSTAKAYAKVGLTLDLDNGGTAYEKYGCYLYGIPWDQLIAYAPPSHSS